MDHRHLSPCLLTPDPPLLGAALNPGSKDPQLAHSTPAQPQEGLKVKQDLGMSPPRL